MSNRASHGEWLVNVADDEVKPMTTLEVIDALRKGRLSQDALVWRNGMNDWTSVQDVPQLRLAASSRPPPPLVEPPKEVVTSPAAVIIQVEPAASEEDTNSAEYVDSDAHFEPASIPEPEESEPVTTLMREPMQALMQSSLAPTTAEASDSARPPSSWGDIDQLLSSEQRADQQHTRRVVLWGALGAAATVAAFTLFVVRSPAEHESPPPASAEQPNSAPLLPEPTPAATLEAPAPASASVAKHAPTAPRATPKSGAPRFSRRPKHAAPSNPADDPPADTTIAAPTSDATGSTPTVAVVPAAPLEPAPTPSASPPAPSPASNDSP
ncbi:MAG TPA: GYF domain-containing protein [Polyangiaceae bacterium]|nr:GYF domain-containing protein [Polyangiaceae bacterium]